jgi:hypothetical protein
MIAGVTIFAGYVGENLPATSNRGDFCGGRYSDHDRRGRLPDIKPMPETQFNP